MNNILKQKFQRIEELLNNSQNILIASHEHPDADAVASTLALHRLFKKQNKNSFPYLPDLPSKNLNFLPGFYDIKTEIDSFDADLVFCLDYGDFERLRLPGNIEEQKIITIDHHIYSNQKGIINVIQPEASSTCEIIYLWLKELSISIDKEIATCLLAGIVSDSGSFRHVTTSSRTLKASAHLILEGAPLQKICRKTSCMYDKPGICKIWGKILSRVKTDKKSRLAFSWVSFDDLSEYKVQPKDLAGIASAISSISQAKVGLFLVEYEKGKIKGSLRSEPYKGQEVARLAEAFGGGGHMYASGFKTEGTIEETLKKVKNLIE